MLSKQKENVFDVQEHLVYVRYIMAIPTFNPENKRTKNKGLYNECFTFILSNEKFLNDD